MPRQSRDGTRDRWRAEVLRSSLIGDSVRVVLIVMAEAMTEAGYVSLPRNTLAKTINRAPRRVTERIELARLAGFLNVIRPGKPGQTAEYVATLPAHPHGAPVRTKPKGTSATRHGADSSHHSVRTGAPSKPDTHGADGGPTNTRARTRARNYPETRERTGDERNAGDAPSPNGHHPSTVTEPALQVLDGGVDGQPEISGLSSAPTPEELDARYEARFGRRGRLPRW